MLRLIALMSILTLTTLPASAQDRVLRWQNLDPTTTDAVLHKLQASGFELQGMRALSLIVSPQACQAGCTVREAGCACPKAAKTCPDGTEPSPGGALCTGPLSGLQVMLEDGRIGGPIDLP